MMMFMPVVLTGMFLSLPSGLAIYYLVTQSLPDRPAVLHQPDDRPAAVAQPARPPADRRLKSAGGGKTPGRRSEEVRAQA